MPDKRTGGPVSISRRYLAESGVKFGCLAEECVYGEADEADIDKEGKPYVGLRAGNTTSAQPLFVFSLLL